MIVNPHWTFSFSSGGFVSTCIPLFRFGTDFLLTIHQTVSTLQLFVSITISFEFPCPSQSRSIWNNSQISKPWFATMEYFFLFLEFLDVIGSENSFLDWLDVLAEAFRVLHTCFALSFLSRHAMHDIVTMKQNTWQPSIDICKAGVKVQWMNSIYTYSYTNCYMLKFERYLGIVWDILKLFEIS